uniref:TBC1 domain family member 15 n=1 Tax=Elaeophora elaphi TaxID=1147741 RepID=A0A0R3RVK5_9BILA
MIPAYLVYRHYQKRKGAVIMEALDDVTSTHSSFTIRETFTLQGVAAKRVVEGEETEDCYISGKLSLIEKPYGVMIEWIPMEEDGWVLAAEDESENLSTSSDSGGSRRDYINKLKFSIDIKDLRSFQCVEPKKGYPWIRFIGKDGSGYTPLYFRQGGISSFTDNLQRYATLKRSAREANLVLFTDERLEAFEQSVSILDLNSDFFSRMMAQPYATAMTGLGKVATFVQEQVIPSMLESDAVSAEEKIRAMRELREKEDEAAGVLRSHDDAGFELITHLELPQRPEFTREQPLTETLWQKYKMPDGSIKDVHSLKVLIFRGGLDPSLRKEAWKYLLGVYDWKKSFAENEAMYKKLSEDYYRMKLQWKTINKDQENRFSEFAARKALIDKDVSRTDRTHAFFGGCDNGNLILLNDILMTYCMYNFDLGYVQGMSDFLSPLLVVLQNEVHAFWAFVGLLKRVHRNFELDQSAIKKQLMDLRDLLMVVNPKLANYLGQSHNSDDMYFCFRWVLVVFKREFCFDDIMRLWEVLWTDLPCSNFHLLICVAILDQQMNFIIENKFGLTEILKHVNDLSMHIDLNDTLTSAEAIFHQLAASQDKLPIHVCKILSLGDFSDSSES